MDTKNNKELFFLIYEIICTENQTFVARTVIFLIIYHKNNILSLFLVSLKLK